MNTKTYSLLIAIYVIALIGMIWIRYAPMQEPEIFEGCIEAVEIPIVKASTFTYCPETDKTWKPYWRSWGEPSRFERERIEQESK